MQITTRRALISCDATCGSGYTAAFRVVGDAVSSSSNNCAVCRSATELLRARPLVEGYELRDYPCPQCGGVFQIVVKCEEAPPAQQSKPDNR